MTSLYPPGKDLPGSGGAGFCDPCRGFSFVDGQPSSQGLVIVEGTLLEIGNLQSILT